MSDSIFAVLSELGVPEAALSMRFIRSSGPGGQNVNKVSTAVQLSCDLKLCTLNAAAQARLRSLAGRRVSSADVLSITAQRLRTQEQNKRDALERLEALVTQARLAPKLRKATKPSKASKRKRLENKVQHGQRKKMRGKVAAHE